MSGIPARVTQIAQSTITRQILRCALACAVNIALAARAAPETCASETCH
ncbi:MAG TPA: hypothetical protein VFJ12_10680 [Segeticoccus sp.]|nr:hypothetical protein [Segeticoccus sp.]